MEHVIRIIETGDVWMEQVSALRTKDEITLDQAIAVAHEQGYRVMTREEGGCIESIIIPCMKDGDINEVVNHFVTVWPRDTTA